MPSESPRPAPSRSGVRSVKIGEDERSGYSSDRTRRGEPTRDADEQRQASVRRARGRRLAPSNRISYPPASVIVLAGPATPEKAQFLARLFDKGAVAVISLARIQERVAGGAGGPDARAKAIALIEALAVQRLRSGQSVVIDDPALAAEDRQPLVLVAQRARRPVHLILLEGAREGEEAETGGALRRQIEREGLAEEGFSTVLTLSPRVADQVRQVGFDFDVRAALD